MLKKESDFVLGNYLYTRLDVEAGDYDDFHTKICQYFIFSNALIHFMGYQSVLFTEDIESIIQKFDIEGNLELERLYSFRDNIDPLKERKFVIKKSRYPVGKNTIESEDNELKYYFIKSQDSLLLIEAKGYQISDNIEDALDFTAFKNINSLK